MNFLRNTMLRVKSARLDRYIAGADRAKDVQRQNLLERVARNANSQFGRDHGFGEIRSIDDFRRRLPIANYEPHRPYIDRVMRGDIEALFEAGTKIWMFAETSGTTAEPKHIPITDRFYRQYKAGWQAWGTGLYRDHPHLLHRQTLQFTSHWKTSFAPSGTPCGNISGLASETRPFYMGSLFVLPKAVIRIIDFSAKHYTALRLSLASDRVGMIITANPSTLIEIAKRIDRDKESLIRDIHDGTLSADVNVPEPIRQQLQPRMRANPRRARELSAMADRAGVLRPQDVWPGLEMLAVWTGGSVGIYLDQLPDYFGDIMLRDHGISASEGRMTFPLENGRASGPLDYASHFYEFIPVDEKDDDDPTTLEAHELEVGSDYYILLTTDAGLYRYDIHDLVRCTGYMGQTPLLIFLNKGKHFSSITGEKIYEYHVLSALEKCCDTFGIKNDTYTLAPDQTDPPQYVLVVTDSMVAGREEQVRLKLQDFLCEQNHEYADKCASGRLQPVGIFPIPTWVWDEVRREKTAERGNFEEYKHPCLTNDLNYLPMIRRILAAGPPQAR